MKKQWVWKSRKERTEPVDRDDIFRVIGILRKEFGLYGLSGEAFQDADGVMYPDIFIKSVKPQIVIELQGQYHGSSEMPTNYTWTKANRYEKMGFVFYDIWKAESGDYDEQQIIQRLKALGLRRN